MPTIDDAEMQEFLNELKNLEVETRVETAVQQPSYPTKTADAIAALLDKALKIVKN